MLTPEQLDHYPDSLVNLYAQTERDIIADMARRINTYDYFIPSAEWQYRKLAEMNNVHDDILKQFAQQSGKSKEELLKLMKEAGQQSISVDDAMYNKAGLAPLPLGQSAALLAVLDAGLKKTNGLFTNLTKTTANTATKQFEDALDRAYMQITSGAFDANSAIRTAIKDLAKQGVASIQYPTGHIDHMDVAVRRATLTGVSQTALKMQEARADEMGCDLVEVTAHAGARPAHAAWQGGIYSRSGNSSQYENFEYATGYGTGAGLGGWNCKHSWFPYFEGISKPAYTQKELDEFTAKTKTYNGKKMTEYDASQKQRYIERQIRAAKREYAGMEAAGLDTVEAASQISKWQDIQKDFLQQTGLKRQGDREQIPGFGKREAGKVTQANRITTTGGLSGAIKDPVRQGKHAVSYYEAIRKRSDDINKVAQTTGWSKESIKAIKDHVFLKEHLLSGKMQRFDPDFQQALAWQRLCDGKKVLDTDLVLLKHEYLELTLMGKKGYTYDKAHGIANEYHNWAKLLKEG